MHLPSSMSTGLVHLGVTHSYIPLFNHSILIEKTNAIAPSIFILYLHPPRSLGVKRLPAPPSVGTGAGRQGRQVRGKESQPLFILFLQVLLESQEELNQ